jgi:hypothetical protein
MHYMKRETLWTRPRHRSNANCNQAELKEVSRCAALGKTQCISLQKKDFKAINQLH